YFVENVFEASSAIDRREIPARIASEQDPAWKGSFFGLFSKTFSLNHHPAISQAPRLSVLALARRAGRPAPPGIVLARSHP
ncbi:hypothetical protein, partial [Achromobacter insuavis]